MMKASGFGDSLAKGCVQFLDPKRLWNDRHMPKILWHNTRVIAARDNERQTLHHEGRSYGKDLYAPEIKIKQGNIERDISILDG